MTWLNYLKSLGNKKKVWTTFIVVSTILLIVALSVVLPMQKSERVDGEELENYARAYLKKYREVVEDNFHLVHDIEHVFFKYNNNPKVVYCVISRTHGAAILFKYNTTERTYWNIKVIDKPIEYYFWPNMSDDLSNLKIVKIIKSDSPYVLNSQINIKNFALLLVDKEVSLYYTGKNENPFKIEGPGLSLIHI